MLCTAFAASLNARSFTVAQCAANHCSRSSSRRKAFRSAHRTTIWRVPTYSSSPGCGLSSKRILIFPLRPTFSSSLTFSKGVARAALVAVGVQAPFNHGLALHEHDHDPGLGIEAQASEVGVNGARSRPKA